MYNVIQSVIHTGGYKLGDMQYKVNKLWLQGNLTEDQADKLLSQAAAGATVSAERPELLEMIRNLSARMDTLAAEIAAIKGTDQPAEVQEVWKPWDGISDKYQPGAIVTHNGKTWISNYPGQNVWEPGTVDESFWEEQGA